MAKVSLDTGPETKFYKKIHLWWRHHLIESWSSSAGTQLSKKSFLYQPKHPFCYYAKNVGAHRENYLEFKEFDQYYYSPFFNMTLNV